MPQKYRRSETLRLLYHNLGPMKNSRFSILVVLYSKLEGAILVLIPIPIYSSETSFPLLKVSINIPAIFFLSINKSLGHFM